LTAAPPSPANDEEYRKVCRTDLNTLDLTPPKPTRVATVEDGASFSARAKAKQAPAAPQSPRAMPAVPADYSAKQAQYLQQWKSIRDTVSDPVDQESRRLALKQRLLSQGGE
jgi:hypothetical protein